MLINDFFVIFLLKIVGFIIIIVSTVSTFFFIFLSIAYILQSCGYLVVYYK